MTFLEKIKQDLRDQNATRGRRDSILTDGHALSELVFHFESLDSIVRSYDSETMEKKDAELNEQAKALANAAESYIAVINQILLDDLDSKEIDRILGGALNKLQLHIFEMRKLAARA